MEWITLEKVFENWLENITKYHMHWPCLRMLMMLEFSRNETQINNHYYLTNRMANRVELTFWTHIRQGSRSLSFLFVIHPRSICARHIWDILYVYVHINGVHMIFGQPVRLSKKEPRLRVQETLLGPTYRPIFPAFGRQLCNRKGKLKGLQGAGGGAGNAMTFPASAAQFTFTWVTHFAFDCSLHFTSPAASGRCCPVASCPPPAAGCWSAIRVVRCVEVRGVQGAAGWCGYDGG